MLTERWSSVTEYPFAGEDSNGDWPFSTIIFPDDPKFGAQRMDGFLTEDRAQLAASAPQLLAERDRLRETNAALLGLINQAVDAMVTYVVPDNGVTEKEFANTMIGIFDGPEYRAAMALCEGVKS